MRRMDATSFVGPRAYFTNIDHRVLQNQPHAQVRRQIERELKVLLLLTKHTVVCAASHLTGQFAYDLFRANPVLLDK